MMKINIKQRLERLETKRDCCSLSDEELLTKLAKTSLQNEAIGINADSDYASFDLLEKQIESDVPGYVSIKAKLKESGRFWS